MERVIMYFVMSMVMLYMPQLFEGMSTLFNTPEASSSMNNLATNIANQTQGIMSVLSVFMYISGVAFFMKGTMALKEYIVNGRTDYTPQVIVKAESIAEVKVNVKKQEPVKIKKSLDFEDELLNEKTEFILNKIKLLEKNEVIKNDIENKVLLEKTQSNYLPQIWNNYINVPNHLRNIHENEKLSIYEATHEQLNLLINAMDKIEKRILEEVQFKQEVNEVYLKEKVANM